MFEKLVSDLITRYLRKYVREIDENQLNIGLWGGQVVLEDLELQSSVLEELNLPLFVRAGCIGRLAFSIPWSNLTNAKIAVEVSDVYLIAEPVKPPDTAEELERCLQERKQQLLRVFERDESHREKLDRLVNEEQLSADAAGGSRDDDDQLDGETHKKDRSKSNTSTQQTTAPASKKGTDPSGFLARTVAKLVDNFTISVKNVHVRYEDSLTNQHNRFACGLVLDSIELVAAPQGGRLRFSVGERGIAKTLDLRQLGVYWNTGEGPIEWSNREEFIRLMRSLIPSPSVDDATACSASPEELFRPAAAAAASPVSGANLSASSKANTTVSSVEISNQPPHTYLICPFTAHVDFTVDTERPRNKGMLIKASVRAGLVDVALSERQNRDICAMKDYLTLYPSIVEARARNFKLRPAGSTPASDPARWWRFAALATLHTASAPPTADFIKIRRKRRITYMRLWKTKLIMDAHRLTVTKPIQTELSDLERVLTYRDIIFFRSLARMELLNLFPNLFVPTACSGWWETTKSWLSRTTQDGNAIVNAHLVKVAESEGKILLNEDQYRHLTNLICEQADPFETLSSSQTPASSRENAPPPSPNSKATHSQAARPPPNDEADGEPCFEVSLVWVGARITLYESTNFSHVVSVAEYDLPRNRSERESPIVCVRLGELQVQAISNEEVRILQARLAGLTVTDCSTPLNCFPHMVRMAPPRPSSVIGDHLDGEFLAPPPLLRPHASRGPQSATATAADHQWEEEDAESYRQRQQPALLWVTVSAAATPRTGDMIKVRARMEQLYVTLNSLLLQRIQLFFNNGNTLHAEARSDIATLAARRHKFDRMRVRGPALTVPETTTRTANSSSSPGSSASSAHSSPRSPRTSASTTTSTINRSGTTAQKVARIEFDVLLRGPTVALPLRCDDPESSALCLHTGILMLRNVPPDPSVLLASKYTHLRFEAENLLLATIVPSPTAFWELPERRAQVYTSRTSLGLSVALLREEHSAPELFDVELTLELRRLDFFASVDKLGLLFRAVTSMLPLLDTPVSEFHDVVLSQRSVHAREAPSAASAAYPLPLHSSSSSSSSSSRDLLIFFVGFILVSLRA
mmetsp:Transcript_7156/g.21912  ORF Transcript_7156/g.21912 Transcript_7156/m.21912 type:complete len:1096 (-) Transcript_7156:295-3582(-)